MMKIRVWTPVAIILALGACDPQVPDSAAGVGFGDYDSYAAQRAERDRQLAGPVSVAPPTATGAPSPEQVLRAPVITAQPIGADPALPVARVAPLAASGAAGGISDEQDFDAVASRESIESDAERLRQQREQFQAVQPTVLPDRTGDGGPNIVEFALQTTNAVGQSVYARSFGSERRAARNCEAFTSPDKAQQAFLEMGGPQKDRKSLDPDGDGFACGWDPRPFRRAVQG